MTKPVTYRNVVYTDRVITLYFGTDDDLTIGNSLNDKKLKHSLIYNLVNSFGIPAEQAIDAISLAVSDHNRASDKLIEFKLFKKSAHSSYLKKKKLTKINFENSYDCHIQIRNNKIIEGKPNSEIGYREAINLHIKTSDRVIKTWVGRHKAFLHRLNMFMNRDECYKKPVLKRLLRASKEVSGTAEAKNIDITSVWYREHVDKKLINKPSKSDNPYYAELFIFPVSDDDFIPICLLRINNSTGYLRINFPNIDRRSIHYNASPKDNDKNLSCDYREWSLEEDKYQITFQLEENILQLSIKLFESDDQSDEAQVLAEYAVKFINEKPKMINTLKKKTAQELSAFYQPVLVHGDEARVFESDRLPIKNCISNIANQRNLHSAEQIQAVLKHFDKQLALHIDATFTALQLESDESSEDDIEDAIEDDIEDAIKSYTIKKS
jgi:hypothetical protein